MPRWVQELRRRHVFRVAVGYVVVAWLIIQAASIMLPPLRLPSWTVRAVIAFTILGFPLALVFAWAFEVTPEGIRRTGPAGDAGGDTFAPDPSSLAVLPFTTFGEDSDHESFAQGLHDDLLTGLSRIESLRVISRTSVTAYRDSPRTLPQIGRELGVATVMEGGIQRSGDRVRVNAQLIDARSDEHLWAETYDRALSPESVFGIQEELAERIVEALNVELSDEEEAGLQDRPTNSMPAYDCYTRALGCYFRHTSESLRRMRDYCEQALEHDPGFVQAYALQAQSYTGLMAHGDLTRDEGLAPARKLAEKAINLDGDLAEARLARARVAFYEPDGPLAVRNLRRAVETNPGLARAHSLLGRASLLVGASPEDAAPHIQRAVELDPKNVFVLDEMGVLELARGNHEQAVEWFQRCLEEEPLYFVANLWLMMLYGRLGRAQELMRLARRMRERTNQQEQRRFGIRSFMAAAWAARDDEEEARNWLAKAESAGEAPSSLAHALTALGEHDRALGHLDTLQGSDWIEVEATFVRWNPIFDPLRETDRFQRVIESQEAAWGTLES